MSGGGSLVDAFEGCDANSPDPPPNAIVSVRDIAEYLDSVRLDLGDPEKNRRAQTKRSRARWN
jgi:hypothetical protein